MLLVRTILGFVFLMLVLGLVLFLPAGSLAFWRAWLYLGVFAACTLLVTGYLIRHDPGLLARRVDAGPAAETQRAQQIIQSLASLLFIGLFVVAGLDHRHQWSDVPAAVSLLSEVLVAAGFFVVFLVFRENTYSGATIQVSEGQEVIASGPYRVVRHPMYAGAGVLGCAAVRAAIDPGRRDSLA